jgi:hypothetical protein
MAFQNASKSLKIDALIHILRLQVSVFAAYTFLYSQSNDAFRPQET